MTPRDCPCQSGTRYTQCCAPYHRSHQDAATPEALMRSRFSAFALGLGPYLVRTLSMRHPDRGAFSDEDALARELSRVKDRQRFLGLRVLHAAVLSGDAGEVLFHARVFERGVDRSFAELSDFRREAGAWRYASGVLVPGARLPELDTLTRGRFLALAAEV